ncbi:uncharacterized protein LOC106164891 [Lingula anatina]|uniref:Uncharacterized protein LOC106164891 n=1 Tax=Lingula anatina TaxID=7574 RepID=A0A1S3IJG7_LINAN|nr:uncharacterized protein LOC106164891 [Lingula anatina]|eukprot:XP_013398385.1 uncharacterized protein LOC106164891 [Lingula anatina]
MIKQKIHEDDAMGFSESPTCTTTCMKTVNPVPLQTKQSTNNDKQEMESENYAILNITNEERTITGSGLSSKPHSNEPIKTSADTDSQNYVTSPGQISADIKMEELGKLGVYSPPYKSTTFPFPIVKEMKSKQRLSKPQVIMGSISCLINPLCGAFSLLLLCTSTRLKTSERNLRHSKRLQVASFLIGLLGICCTLAALGIVLALRYNDVI